MPSAHPYRAMVQIATNPNGTLYRLRGISPSSQKQKDIGKQFFFPGDYSFGFVHTLSYLSFPSFLVSNDFFLPRLYGFSIYFFTSNQITQTPFKK